MKYRFSNVAGVLCFTLAALPPALAKDYVYIDLGPGTAFAINNANKVVGHSSLSGHATLWEGSGSVDLGTLGGTNSYAFGINDSNHIVGYSELPGNQTVHATLWKSGATVDLNPSGIGNSAANGINAQGDIVGFADQGFRGNGHAVLWAGTGMSDLQEGMNWSGAGSARAINSTGTSIGIVNNSSYTGFLSFSWTGANTTDLRYGGLPLSYVGALNDLGQIAGAVSANGNSYAMVWDGGSTTILGEGYASGLNSYGEVVGTNAFGATLWGTTGAVELTTLLNADLLEQGWVLAYATAINDAGSIVGEAHNRKTGESHAFLLLSPVPEPTTYSMLLGGLVMFALHRVLMREGKT